MDIIGQVPSPFDFPTQEMVVCHLPVRAGIAVNGTAGILVEKIPFVFEDPIRPLGHFTETRFLQIAELSRSVPRVIDAAEKVHSSGPVIHVHGRKWIVALVPAERLGIRSVEIEAEAFALSTDGADAYHAFYRRIVLGSWIGNHLDALDFIALQAVQLAAVCDSAPVYINEWRSLADDLQAVLPLDHTRRFGEHVLGSPDIFQHRPPDTGLQAFTGQLRLGHNGSYGGTLQHSIIFF